MNRIRRSHTRCHASLILLAWGFACSWPLGAGAQATQSLTIADQSLPPFNAGMDVRIPLHASGGAPPYRWTLTAGSLPDGMALDPAGFLAGRPVKTGAFALTLTVTDSAGPAHVINKEFTAQVSAALLLEWAEPPHVVSPRIDGAVQVSNGSREDFDLTVIIVAVDEMGRATAIGYQRFTLKAGVTNSRIPFGNTLPHGAYVVHADAIAEIPARNTILRQRLQTPAPLSITQGP